MCPQYPYHHDADEDRQQARSFALNDAMVMLAQALPVALLPLLRQPPAAAAGAGPQSEGGGEGGPDAAGAEPAGRATRGRARGVRSCGSHAIVLAAEAVAPALPAALLALLPAAGQLASRLVDAAEERKHKYSPGVSFR